MLHHLVNDKKNPLKSEKPEKELTEIVNSFIGMVDLIFMEQFLVDFYGFF